jgi:hypothetical protein
MRRVDGRLPHGEAEIGAARAAPSGGPARPGRFRVPSLRLCAP